MKYLLSLLAFLFFLITSQSCKKEDLPYPLSELPPATQTGANTFGCIINGKPWVAYAPWNPFGGRFRGTYDEEHYGLDYNQRLWLSALREFPTKDLMNDSISSAFGFDIRPIQTLGYFDMDKLGTYEVSYLSSNPGPTKIYELDTLSPFHINITSLDTIKKIVSGTFEMDLIEIDDPLDVLHIRHGRFDARYEPR